jgi:hypothetical protein
MYTQEAGVESCDASHPLVMTTYDMHQLTVEDRRRSVCHGAVGRAAMPLDPVGAPG